MYKKTILASVILVSTLLAGGVTSAILAYQSSHAATSQPASQQGQPRLGTSSDQKWEYRILTSESEPVKTFQHRGAHLTSFDRQINELSQQGFEVQSFQPVVASYGGTEAVVLLRRPTK